jgi:hypothetical protein
MVFLGASSFSFFIINVPPAPVGPAPPLPTAGLSHQFPQIERGLKRYRLRVSLKFQEY